jgi:AcrR family transcriptional regulator
MRLSKARKEIVTAVMKDTIVEAAGSVLEQHGVGGMTMDRVASTAGLTAGSLYNYFRNKDDLVQFIYERLVEPFFQTLEEIAAGEMPAPKKLEKIVRMGLERAAQDRALIRLLLDSGRESEIRSKARPRALRIITGVFAQGIHEGTFRQHNPAHAGRMFHGCFAGLFDMHVEGASSADINEYAETLIVASSTAFSPQCEASFTSDKEKQHG